MNIAFRTDASVEIGTGHVMRCLTLADALRAEGAACLFLCRPHDGHLLDLIARRGHRVTVLPVARGENAPSLADPPHAHWLGTDWASDADDTRHALAGEGRVDWLVVDHYALDHRWERALRPACHRLMVMDDLADRAHDCDLLLDPSLGRVESDYVQLLPPNAVMLLGPQHALLRPEFAKARAESLARRATPRLRHLLVTMGGVDKDNAAGHVLDALDMCDLASDARITVVMGPHAPWLTQIRERASRMRHPTEVLVGVNDMARLMTDSDLAIGAAGGTSWERCCLGLPTVQLVLAENQKMIADELARAGVAVTADIDSLEETFDALFHDSSAIDLLLAQSHAASAILDGLGTQYVASLLLKNSDENYTSVQ